MFIMEVFTGWVLQLAIVLRKDLHCIKSNSKGYIFFLTLGFSAVLQKSSKQNVLKYKSYLFLQKLWGIKLMFMEAKTS